MRYRMATVRAAMLTGAVLTVITGCSRFQRHRESDCVIEKPVEPPKPRVLDFSTKPHVDSPPSTLPEKAPPPPSPAPLPLPPRSTSTTAPTTTVKRTGPALMPALKPPQVVLEKSAEFLPSVAPEPTAPTKFATDSPPKLERLPVSPLAPVAIAPKAPWEKEFNLPAPTLPSSILAPLPPEQKPDTAAEKTSSLPAPTRVEPRVPEAAPVPRAVPTPPLVSTPVPPSAPEVRPVVQTVPVPEPAKIEPPSLPDLPKVKLPLPEPAAVNPPVLLPSEPTVPTVSPALPAGTPTSAPSPTSKDPNTPPRAGSPTPAFLPTVSPELPTIPVPPLNPDLPPLAARPDASEPPPAEKSPPSPLPAPKPDVVPPSTDVLPKIEPPKPAPVPMPGGNKFDTTPNSSTPMPMPKPGPVMPPRSVTPPVMVPPILATPAPVPLPQGSAVPLEGNNPNGPLGLADAVALAHRLQPRLRVFLESIVQAEGDEKIAHAPFYPTAGVGIGVGGFDLNVGGKGSPAGAPGTNFNFLPGTGVMPVGLNMSSGYQAAELKVQWLLTDFGRRMGRYRQAQLGVDVATLQTDRAFETVAHEVASAYYQVLRTRALSTTVADAVKRAEANLEALRKLQKTGLTEKEKVLRAEVELSQMKRAMDNVEAVAASSLSALNLAIGLNVNCPTEVVGNTLVPPFELCLADCLQEAVAHRRELEVAQRSIQIAQEGLKVAKADFRPRVVADGAIMDFQQGGPRGNADLAVGSIKLEWGLFEGGRRVGEMRVADSKVRAAAAQAEAMADTIAFQVSDAYREMAAAKKGIDRARPALDKARETYKLTFDKLKQGDISPIDATDAENALARAEQDLLSSSFDYMIGLNRLHFAMGLPVVPGK